MPPAHRAARNPSPRAAGTGPAAPTLIGRGPELATLTAALSDAETGHGRTVFVVGESGIGKTRLVSTLADIASRRRFSVAVGRAYPVESGVPYAVFSDALLPMLRGVEPSVINVLTRGGTAELAQLFPALGAGTERSSSVRGDPAELKARLLWNFSQFLSRFAAKQPLLLLLENLQWADSASLEMLHFVARQISSDRILLVGTHNDPDLRGGATLRATDQSLRTLGNTQRVRLAPLTAAAIIEILERRFEADPDRVRAFAERLHRWTGGNPFFIDETIKALVDGGQLRSTPGGWVGWDVEELRVPATIREAVLARLSELSAHARPLADIA